MHYAAVHLALGRYRETSAICELALRLERRTGNTRFERMTLISSSMAAHFQGRLPEAEATLNEALRLEVPSPWSQSAVLANLSAVLAAQDRVRDAQTYLRRAVRAAAKVNRADFERFLALHAGFVEVAKARAAARDGKHVAATRLFASAERRLRDAQSTTPTLELRLSANLLAQTLARSNALSSAKPAIAPSGEVLEVGPAAAWLCADQSQRFDLSQRDPLRRVLIALLDRHGQAPGEPLTGPELIALGWPGERLLAKAAKNRLHNAVSSLRRLGLKRALLTRSDGYLLDPRVRVVRLEV